MKKPQFIKRCSSESYIHMSTLEPRIDEDAPVMRVPTLLHASELNPIIEIVRTVSPSPKSHIKNEFEAPKR